MILKTKLLLRSMVFPHNEIKIAYSEIQRLDAPERRVKPGKFSSVITA
ncbi:MAG: hypothetical protein ACYCSR_11335 [Thiomonas sp.]